MYHVASREKTMLNLLREKTKLNLFVKMHAPMSNHNYHYPCHVLIDTYLVVCLEGAVVPNHFFSLLKLAYFTFIVTKSLG